MIFQKSTYNSRNFNANHSRQKILIKAIELLRIKNRNFQAIRQKKQMTYKEREKNQAGLRLLHRNIQCQKTTGQRLPSSKEKKV